MYLFGNVFYLDFLHGCSVTIKPNQIPQLMYTYHLLAHLACYWPMIWEQVLLLGELQPQVLAVLVILLVLFKKILIHYFRYYKLNIFNACKLSALILATSLILLDYSCISHKWFVPVLLPLKLWLLSPIQLYFWITQLCLFFILLKKYS